jgi:hypothetical protein
MSIVQDYLRYKKTRQDLLETARQFEDIVTSSSETMRDCKLAMKKFLKKRHNDTELLELSNHLDHFIEGHELLIENREVSCEKCNVHLTFKRDISGDEELRIYVAHVILDNLSYATIPALYKGNGGWIRNLFPSEK